MADLRRVVFRVEHDCPVARLSRERPELSFQVWSGHRVEFVVARGARPGEEAAVQEAIRRHLDPVRLLELPRGGGALAVWRPVVDPKASLSRRLEENDLLWLQPLSVRRGWEQFDALAFGPGGEQAALDALRRDHPVQVVRRDDLTGHEAAALFQSLLPVLESPTAKQSEALVTAFDEGYYGSPRQTRTADVAGVMGLSRSAFEERLRGGENRLMAALLPALAHHQDADGEAGSSPS
ncbi:MAG: helix-turn-helix domain-containing protein [Thermoplasmatota archaeon]